eukprot:5492255-Ditylum_brightwellii.AAC.1
MHEEECNSAVHLDDSMCSSQSLPKETITLLQTRKQSKQKKNSSAVHLGDSMCSSQSLPKETITLLQTRKKSKQKKKSGKESSTGIMVTASQKGTNVPEQTRKTTSKTIETKKCRKMKQRGEDEFNEVHKPVTLDTTSLRTASQREATRSSLNGKNMSPTVTRRRASGKYKGNLIEKVPLVNEDRTYNDDATNCYGKDDWDIVDGGEDEDYLPDLESKM